MLEYRPERQPCGSIPAIHAIKAEAAQYRTEMVSDALEYRLEPVRRTDYNSRPLPDESPNDVMCLVEKCDLIDAWPYSTRLRIWG
jgi:hypothetical protein